MSEDTTPWPGTDTHPATVRDEVVLTYYSRTGTTARVAADLAARFAEPAVQRIRPETERRYWNWLARSFVPGSTVPIGGVETDLREASMLVLGSPKWTLSCPPVTEFLERATLGGVPTALFLTYGGFDERRYMDRLVERVADTGADVVATLLVKRDRVASPGYGAALDEFVAAVLDEGR